MFQDSVPAGSYNDPFLSSVCKRLCVTVCKRLCVKALVCKSICVSKCLCKSFCVQKRLCVKASVCKSVCDADYCLVLVLYCLDTPLLDCLEHIFNILFCNMVSPN